MLRRSGKVCADELLEDLDQLHARNIQRGTARSSETPARAFRQQSVHGDVSESTDSEDEHHVVNPRVASKLPSRMKQPQQLDGKRFSQVDAKAEDEKLSDLRAMSMCRYAFTLVLVLLVGLLLGAVACCYFVATVCPTSPLLLDGYVDQGGKAD